MRYVFATVSILTTVLLIVSTVLAVDPADVDEILAAGEDPGNSYTAEYEPGETRTDTLLGGSLATPQHGVQATDQADATDGNLVSATIEGQGYTEWQWKVELALNLRGWASTENYYYDEETSYAQTVTVTASCTDYSGDWEALDAADSGVVSYANESQYSQYDDAHIVVDESNTEEESVEFEYRLAAQVSGSISRGEMAIKCRAERTGSENAGYVECRDTSSNALIIFSYLD